MRSQRAIRIGIIHHGASIGGATASLLDFLKSAQTSPGLEMTLFCFSGAMQQYFGRHLRIPVRGMPDPLATFGKVLIWGIDPLEVDKMGVFLRSCGCVRKCVREQEAMFREYSMDIVHLSSAVLFTSAIAAKMAGQKILWQVREMASGGAINIRRRIVGRFIRSLADAVLVPTKREAERLGMTLGRQCLVLRHPVAPDSGARSPDERQEARARLGIRPDIRVVLSTGGVSHWKGTVELLLAMQRTSEDVHLYLAGPIVRDLDGDVALKKRAALCLEDWCVRFGVQNHPIANYHERVRLAWRRAPQDRIHFVGYQDGIADWFAAADLVVYAATGPHYPRGVFDAWANRKAVVVFGVDGVRQLVGDGVSGWVVRPGDWSQLGAVIQSAVHETEELARRGTMGQTIARKECDATMIANRITSLYRELVLGVRSTC